MEQSGVSSDDVGERTNNGMERISAFWRMERNRVCEDEREIKEMGLPNINIAFKSTAASAIERSEKGVVALIIKDAKENGGHAYTNASQIPATLGTDNQAYIHRGYPGGDDRVHHGGILFPDRGAHRRDAHDHLLHLRPPPRGERRGTADP